MAWLEVGREAAAVATSGPVSAGAVPLNRLTVAPLVERVAPAAVNVAVLQASPYAQNPLPPLPDGKRLAQAPSTYEGEEYLGSLLADIEGWLAVASDAGPDMFVTVVSDQFVSV